MEQLSWWQSVGFPYLNFALFLIVLIYFARAPLRKLARQRREDYLVLLTKAQELQAQASAQLATLNKRLAGLDAEVAALRQSLNAEAKRDAEEIVRKGEEIKRFLHEEASRVRAAEVARAQQELQQQIVAVLQGDLSKQVASKWRDAEHAAFVRQQRSALRKIVS